MAKKNAREEPPKPQVTENEQMSDIVFILDKMELILEAVSQIGKDGKFNTVAADKKSVSVRPFSLSFFVPCFFLLFPPFSHAFPLCFLQPAV